MHNLTLGRLERILMVLMRLSGDVCECSYQSVEEPAELGIYGLFQNAVTNAGGVPLLGSNGADLGYKLRTATKDVKQAGP